MVYEYIRQQMREGSLLPGSVLDLPAISHKLGISNTPLRDSLIRLEAEGYLTIYPRSKVVINTLEAEDFPFLYEIMGALEYTIIAGSIDQYTEATIAKMRRLSGDMREAVMSGDMVTYDRLHYLFHSVFLKFPPISSPSVSSRPSRTACGIFLAKILCANGIWPPWRNTPSSSTLLRNAITADALRQRAALGVQIQRKMHPQGIQSRLGKPRQGSPISGCLSLPYGKGGLL